MSHIVSYSRVSTTRQGLGDSLKCQRDRIRAFAEGHAAGQNLSILGEFHDDLSGMEMQNRPGVLAAISMACRNRCPLVVTNLSRLARSTKDALEIVDRLSKAHSSLHSLGEAIDTSTPTGRMVWTVLAAAGQWAAESGALATRIAVHHRQKALKRQSYFAPWGFQLSEDSEHLIEIPEEQRVLADMVAMRESGDSYQRIADQLNARGIRSKLGHEWSPRSARLVLARAAKLAA